MNKRILEYIPEGKKNAISAQRLAEITGAKSQRCLRGDIAELRKAGELICSNPAGYYKPATREELAGFIRMMDSHAIGVFSSIASARKALQQMEGQTSIEDL